MQLSEAIEIESPLYGRGETVVGIDEVGRGALAGPVVVGAAVRTSWSSPPSGLDDSKKLTPRRRETLVPQLIEWVDDYALGSCSAAEIDEWGMRVALAVAATRALEGLALSPTFALIDGSFNLLSAPADVPLGVATWPTLRYARLPHQTLVKGDQRSALIATAAVLAKVHRDSEMVARSAEFPLFSWNENKGYGSAAHLAALRKYGPTPWHRRSWHLPERENERPARTQITSSLDEEGLG